MKATALLDSVVNYYYPNGLWSTFKGNVHLYSIAQNGDLRSEDIYLDNEKDLYQSFLYQNDSIIMRQWEKGNIIYSVNGVSNLSIEDRKALKLLEEDITFFKKFHRSDIGWPMNIKSLDIVLNPKIKETTFNDELCWGLESIGTPPGTEVNHPLLQQSIFYYINPDDFSLIGMDFPLIIEQRSIPGFRVTFNQEIEVGGIKIPQVKTYYRLKDNSYLYTTALHPYPQQKYIDEKQEQAAINKVLDAETYYFEKRNYEAWADTWSHKDDVLHSFSSKDGYTLAEGWDALSQFMLDFFKQYPEPQPSPVLERSNFVYHIHNNIAWVFFDSKETTSEGRHQRILRKENGAWKLVNMTGIDEGSFR